MLVQKTVTKTTDRRRVRRGAMEGEPAKDQKRYPVPQRRRNPVIRKIVTTLQKKNFEHCQARIGRLPGRVAGLGTTLGKKFFYRLPIDQTIHLSQRPRRINTTFQKMVHETWLSRYSGSHDVLQHGMNTIITYISVFYIFF